MPAEKKRVLSGMRPTGKLHLGHLVGALKNWVEFQRQYDCFFMVADWHALMSEYEHPDDLRASTLEMVADWIAAGIDPQRSVIFRQSDVPEHLELYMVLSILTPLGWVERVPTYKEQLREVKGRDLTTYGFLGYPVLQAADILLYQANVVPVGEDQVSHLELAREIVRRFKSLYGQAPFPEPQAKLTPSPRLLGLDGRKMSKSYDNVINLSDEPDLIRKKIQSMFTDPQRVKKTDPGHPETCNLCAYYPVFAPDRTERVWDECRTAKRGCVDNKKELADVLIEVTEPIRRARTERLRDPGQLMLTLRQGAEKARARARETMAEVRRLVGIGATAYEG
ncbi:MAG: tryptophan--tRNA ligase [Candidatus Omnitrophica bacterium]|nr:tryptophan--tRNA ligase [Candidatus Omnitrophota bacterium]